MEAAVELIAHRRAEDGDDISSDALRAAMQQEAKRGSGGKSHESPKSPQGKKKRVRTERS